MHTCGETSATQSDIKRLHAAARSAGRHRHCRAIGTRLLAQVVVFFFLYSVQFTGAPGGLGTRIWLGIAGFIFVVARVAINSGRARIELQLGLAILLLMLLGVQSLIAALVNSTFDPAFIVYLPQMASIAFAAFFAAATVKFAYPDYPYTAARSLIVAAVVVQLSVSLLMFFVPPVASILNEVQITSELDASLLQETVEFRLSGFGSRFFGAGIINCYALIMIGSLVRTVELSHLRLVGLLFAFVFISSVGMMMSRTTMIGAALAILLLILPTRRSMPAFQAIRRQRHLFVVALFLLAIIILIIVSLLSDNIILSIEPAFRFGFEFFVSYLEEGSFQTDSTTQLLSMYSGELRLPLLFGDGLYADPSDAIQYYKAIDIGYLRLIYYFGLPGLIIYLLFQHQAIRMSAAHLAYGENRILIMSLTALLFALLLKGFADIFLYSIFLYACSSRHQSMSKHALKAGRQLRWHHAIPAHQSVSTVGPVTLRGSST